MKKTKAKMTIIRKLVVKNCKHDFGLGKGIIAQDEITYKDENERGFKSPLFALAVVGDADEMIKKFVEVKFDEKK